MTFSPKRKYSKVSRTITLRSFAQLRKKYISRPPYQRKAVWSTIKKQAMLDSLFRGYYVPKLVLREVGENAQLELVDGQQRLIVAFEFFGNTLKTPKSLADLDPRFEKQMYLKDLDDDMKEYASEELSYDVDIIVGISEKTSTNHQLIVTEIFKRLQDGVPLNAMERLYSQVSSLARNFIVKYADDETFDFEIYAPVDNNPHKLNFFSLLANHNNRMKHLQLLGRFLLLEEAGGPTDVGDGELGKLIEATKQDDGVGNYSYEESQNAKNTLSTLKLFYNIFKDDEAIRGTSDPLPELSIDYFILSFYLFIRKIKLNYVLANEDHSKIRDFFHWVYKRWCSMEADNDLLVFSTNMQQHKHAFTIRESILDKMFIQYQTENDFTIPTKDIQRGFTHAQRYVIYRDQKGLCQECLAEGKPLENALVPWSNYHADHIKPHSKGGQTDNDNIQVLCSTHNLSKGNRT